MTITKERLLKIQHWRETYGADSNVMLPAEEAEELARIALASLEAKPIGAFHIADQQVSGTTDYIKDGEWPIDNGVIEVYAAPPAPVVPEKMNFSTACNFVQINGMAKEDRATLAMRAWNACRSAMLQGIEPVSQTYNLPELIEGMEVSIDVSTCDADAGNRYFGTVTEVSELYTAKNGYILLVQDAKPNFDVNGNTPVQSPIDHGYRPECECSGCKATARICAELAGSSTVIGIDPASGPDRTVEVHYVAPPGYVMVPNVPTDEMIAAAMNCEDVLFNSDESFCVQFGNIYEAMLAAAPQHEVK